MQELSYYNIIVIVFVARCVHLLVYIVTTES